MEAQLGSNAPRELVAEILFRALLTEMVDYTVLNGYVKNGKTLGKENLGLEEIEGVVMANEFADLNTPAVLPEGKTQIQVEGEDNVRTLNITTKITDIGESRVVYTQNVSKVLEIADTGKNTTKEYGASVDIRTAAKFRDASGLNETANTEYYTNFEPTGYYTSDWRIEYTILLDMTADEATAYTRDNGGRYLTDANPISGSGHTHDNGATYYWYNYNKAIKAGDPITLTDMNNIYTIFTTSNGVWGADVDQLLPRNEIGQVFVGTQTKDDISDKISYNQFVDTYVNPIVSDKNWASSENGEWVKFIDNNGDGNAEYAFLTQYALTEAVSTYTNKAGNTVIQYSWDNAQNTATDVRLQNFDDDDHTHQSWDYTVRYMKDDEAIERDVAVGDIVLAAYIDNQFLVSKPETVTTEATNYNYKADEITATDGNTYGQSGIWNNTTMQNLLASMAPKTTYEMFLDKFGFVRAYRLPGGTQYALVTELYYTNNAQGNMVQDWPMTVELVMPNEDGTLIKKEYNLANRNTELRGLAAWTQITNLAQTGSYYNWLQPAIAHLGVTWGGMTPVRVAPTLGAANLTYWRNSLQKVSPITALNGSTEFDYGKQNYIGATQANSGNPVPTDPTTSFTNVAVVNIDGDNATINGAAKVRLNQKGEASNQRNANDYAVDYIQLTRNNVAKGAVSFPVGGSAQYQQDYNRVVNADNNTQIYVVYDGGVKYFKGYANMPALNADTVGSIHAAYAVARNTTTGSGNTAGNIGTNYWIADVLVFEVEKWDDLSETSISLAYYTYNQNVQSATGVTIDTLNNKTDPAKVQLVPANLAWGNGSNWWDSWGYNSRTGFGWNTSDGTGYGFYRLYNESAPVEGVMTAAAIEKITKDFNKAGIFAGTVAREVDLATAAYIPVNMTGKTEKVNGVDMLKVEAQVSIADGKVYSITWEGDTNETSYHTYYEANNLYFNNTVYSKVKANDRIIWVGSGDQNTNVQKASFIVDLGSNINGNNDLVDNTALWNSTASWLKNDSELNPNVTDGLWARIMNEQRPVADTESWTVTIKHVTGAAASADGTAIDGVKDIEIKVKKTDAAKGWSISADELALPGYTLSAVYKDGDTTNTAITKTYNSYGENSLSGDVTILANYTNSGFGLTVKGTANYTSTVSASTYDASGVTKTQAATALTTSGFAPLSAAENAPFTVTVTPVANELITADDIVFTAGVKDGKVTKNNDGTFTVTGIITGQAVITVTAAASHTVTAGTVRMITGNNDGITNSSAANPIYTDVPAAATIAIADPTVVAKTGSTTVTVTPAAGYRVIGVAPATKTATVSKTSDNTWTVSSVSGATTINVLVAYTVSTSSGAINAGNFTSTAFSNFVKAYPAGVYTVETDNGFWANNNTKKDAWSCIAFVVDGAVLNDQMKYTIKDANGQPIVQNGGTVVAEPLKGHAMWYTQVILDQYGKIDGSDLSTPLAAGRYTVEVTFEGKTTSYTLNVGPQN
jgi:hypothetical protein